MKQPFVPARDASASLAAWLKNIPTAKLAGVLETAMRNAAEGLSGMVGYTLHVLSFQVTTVPLTQMIAYAGDPEAETVGVYLLLKGDLCGQAILLLSPADARKLTELLTDAPSGSLIRQPIFDSHGAIVEAAARPRKLSDLERSALAEVGNLMVSYFLNALAKSLGRPQPLLPSPPAVMVDMLGAVLGVVATPIAAQSDDLLAVACDLQAETSYGLGTGGAAERMLQIRLWIMPDPAA
jgi:chemotaxis protein CheC